MRTQYLLPVRLAALVLIWATSAGWAQDQSEAPKAREPRAIEKLAYPKLNDVKIPPVARATLPNGLRLILVEDHELPQIQFRALVKGGRIAEPKGRVGLAELFGEVQRTGGTKTMSGDQVDELLERLGASVETSVGEAYGEVSGRTLIEHLDKVLPVFVEFLRAPAFAPDKVDLAKTHLRSLIARRNDDAQEIAQREIQKLIYGQNSPYARQIEYEDIDALTQADLVGFHGKFYRPDTTLLAVWGDFRTADLKERLAQAFDSWQAPGPPPAVVLPELPASVASLNYIEKKDVEQTFIVMGHLGLRLDDPDYPAVNLLSEILGGGFSSRLFVSVRTTKGLAYGAGGWMIPAYDHRGWFSFYTSTKPATTAEALSTMLDEIRKIRQAPVTDAELRRAREGYLNSYAFEYDSIAKIVARLATYEFYGYPADFNVQFRKAVEKVTQEDLLRVAQKHLQPEALTILAIGRSDQFDKPLSTFGKVTTLDIKIPEPKPKEVVPEATAESLKTGTDLLVKVAKAVGESALMSLKDLTSEGASTVKTPMGEMELKGKIVFVLPSRLRLEFTTPMGVMVQILDGEKAWMKMGTTSQELPASAVAELRQSLYTMNGGVLLLQQVLTGKIQGQALGRKQFEGQEAEAVLVRLGDTPMKVFLSLDGASILGFTMTTSTPEGPAETVETLGAYQAVAGLRVPMQSTQKVNGEVKMSIKVSSARLNQGIAEALFAKP